MTSPHKRWVTYKSIKATMLPKYLREFQFPMEWFEIAQISLCGYIR